jgi:TrmH family RNA methyltransferase
LAGIEGPNLIGEALRAGLRIRCLFAAQGNEHLLEALPLSPETEVLLMPAELLDSALATETPQSIAALVEPPDWTWAHLLGTHKSRAALIVVLAGLQDPGNLGTILRNAEAFGADGVLSLPGTVSAWNPKAVRASAGSVFRVPLLAVATDQIDLGGPVAFLIGNEGNGVPPELAAQAHGALTIPCPGPVESLNAAVAAGVLLYEASRQRGIKP